MKKSKLYLLTALVLLFSCLIGCSSDSGNKGIKLSFSHEEIELKQYTEVEETLRELGFHNISYETTGIHSTTESDVGDVVGVFFDGEWDFSEGDVFDADVPIVISYLIDNAIEVPLSSEDVLGIDCKEAEKIFRDAGFTEIHLYTMEGDNLQGYDNRIVGLVTIGFMGSSYYTDTFVMGDKFCQDDWITIYCNTVCDPEETSGIVIEKEDINKSDNVDKVWVTRTGSKYHSKQSCGNSDGMIQIPLSEAESQGLTKCKRCH